jgi:hypothetical protein
MPKSMPSGIDRWVDTGFPRDERVMLKQNEKRRLI